MDRSSTSAHNLHMRRQGLAGLLGIALGWGWYRLHPRELGARLSGVATLAAVIGVLAAVFGGHGFIHWSVSASGVAVGAGVLVGLVITERRSLTGPTRWGDRHAPLTSRETMRELR